MPWHFYALGTAGAVADGRLPALRAMAKVLLVTETETTFIETQKSTEF